MIKFGTGGFRAIIGDEFTKINMELIAQGLVHKMRDEKAENTPLIIGYDRRFLSDVAAQWVSCVFAANGIRVQYIDTQAPTPLIMFVVKKTGAKYGMAITASHNPAEYNGVKVFTEGGRDASKEVTNDLEAYISKIADDQLKTMDFDEALKNGMVEIIEPMNDYIDSILAVIDIEKIKSKH
ncbi:MAG: phosphoglucomutase/phosphomannomutase family protein, partial [Oscillospiraceae bacterium]